jgi:flagellar assembly protein FliH
VIILGEPDIAPGDARFDWADGGVVIDHAQLEQTIAAAAEQVLGKRPDDLLR